MNSKRSPPLKRLLLTKMMSTLEQKLKPRYSAELLCMLAVSTSESCDGTRREGSQSRNCAEQLLPDGAMGGGGALPISMIAGS